MKYPTLADTVGAYSSHFSGVFQSIELAAPELSVLPVQTIPGRKMEFSLQKAGVTGFRGTNEGVSGNAGKFEPYEVNTYILDASIAFDKSVIGDFPGGVNAYAAKQLANSLRSRGEAFSTQFYWGLTGNTLGADKGFKGLAELVDPSMVYKFGTATTGRSAFLVSVSQNPCADSGVCVILGNNGLPQVSEGGLKEAWLYDENRKGFNGYSLEFVMYVGLYAPEPALTIVEMQGLGGNAVDGLLTVRTLAEAKQFFKASSKPTHLFCSPEDKANLDLSISERIIVDKKTVILGVHHEYEDFMGMQIVVSDTLSQMRTVPAITA